MAHWGAVAYPVPFLVLSPELSHTWFLSTEILTSGSTDRCIDIQFLTNFYGEITVNINMNGDTSFCWKPHGNQEETGLEMLSFTLDYSSLPYLGIVYLISCSLGKALLELYSPIIEETCRIRSGFIMRGEQP